MQESRWNMASFKGYKRSIVLDFSYDKVKQGVPDVNRQMALLNAEFRKASEEVKKTGSSFEKMGLQQEMLTTKTKLQSDKVEILKKELENLSKAEGNNEKAIARKTIELTKAETQLSKTESELSKVTKEVEDQSSKLGTMSTKWQDTTERMKEAGVDIDAVATGMIKVGAVLASGAVVGTKFAMDFEDSMAKAKTIADTTEVSFEELEKGVIGISNAVGQSSKDVAAGLYEVLSANVDTADSLYVLNDATMLAKTGFTDTSTSVDLLTTIINSYGMEAKASTELTDKLIITQKLGKLTVGELGESFGKVAGLAATANVPINELLAATSTLTSNGIKSAEAMTGLRGVISAVIKPSQEATAEAKRLGLQFDLASLQSRGLAGFLEHVEKRTKGNSDSMAKLFGNVNGLNSMFILTGNGAEKFASDLNQIENSSGTADKAFADLDTRGEKLRRSFNELKNKAIEVGDTFAPLVTIFTGFLTVLSNIPSSVIVIISAIGGLLVIVGTIIKSIGTVATTITSVKSVMDLFNSTTGNATFITFVKWAGIIIAVTLAITALVVAINYLIGRGSEMNRAVADISGTMNKAQGAVADTSRKGYAIGTNYAEGGWADVGEHGKERMYVPRGSKIHDAGTTKYMEEQEQQAQNASNQEISNKLDQLINIVAGVKQEVYNMPQRQQAIDRMGIAKG